MHEQSTPRKIPRRLLIQAVSAGLCGAIATFLPGCSLGVMFGKMVMGEPLVPADFRTMTGEDLTKGKHTVLVVCKAPNYVDEDNSTLSYDLIDGVTRRMKLNGVQVVNPDQVASWVDEHGGVGIDPTELAEEFNPDYVVVIEVQSFSYREPNSPKLLRGQAAGYVRAYEVLEVDGHYRVNNVFVREFNSKYPKHQPLQEEQRSEIVFQKEYMDRFCDALAQKFYDHRPGTDF
ncbi:MAG: hypothetical protein JSS49_13595 [Planctomycetes bacterium]|nr:hypothetical protein [Planctomycetota bacterium]